MDSPKYSRVEFVSSPELSPEKKRSAEAKSLEFDLEIEEKGESPAQNEFILLPTEWKLMIIVYFGVLVGAVFFNTAIAYPTNLTSRIAKFAHSVFGGWPALEDLLFLSIIFCFSIPLISFIFIPIPLKIWNKWVFDQAISRQAAIDDKVHWRQYKDIADRGIFRIPNEILQNPQKYQLIPIKWKFIVFIYISVLISEGLLWTFLYKYGLSQWDWSNIHDDSINGNGAPDIRIRFCIFLSLDLLISIPLVDYIILPVLINRIFPKYFYKKIEKDQGNWIISLAKCITYALRNGIYYLEYIDRDRRIADILERKSVIEKNSRL